MKKLLLVLLVVTLASFLFVGCLPGVVADDDDEDDENDVVVDEICPTVAVSDSVVIGTKNYLKAGKHTITVTFAVPTSLVSVYVGPALSKDLPVGVPDESEEVVIHTADGGLTYTGTHTFGVGVDCDDGYIYVVTCDTCAPCKSPYIVDSAAPTAKIKICAAECVCPGCAITFTSTVTTGCPDATTCIDACSGLATWNIDIYDKALGDCCTIACGGTLIDSGTGTACPISWTTDCLSTDTGDEIVYAYVTLADKVGNSTIFGYKIEQEWDERDTCSTVTVTDLDETDCLDPAVHVACPAPAGIPVD